MAKLSTSAAHRLYQEGLKLVKEGKYSKAHATFQTILKTFPNSGETWYQAGLIEERSGRPFSAARSFEYALRAQPENPTWIRSLGNAAIKAGRSDYAEKLFRRLRKIEEDSLSSMLDHASSLNQTSEFENAAKIYADIMKRYPNDGNAYSNGFRIRKFSNAKDPLIKQAEQKWLSLPATSEQRMCIGFALSKAMEDVKAYDRVFHYLRPACDYLSENYPFNAEQYLRVTQHYLDRVQDKRIARLGSSDFSPIFIVGSPRSGTTLVDQILASHPEIASGGEINTMLFMFSRYFGVPFSVAAPTDVPLAKLNDFAAQYEAAARETAQSYLPHIVDKSMRMDSFIGWLAAAYPKAKFVVINRDRRDNALSIYKNFFGVSDHHYANNLKDIATVLHGFERNIEHWRSRVDLVDLNYDDLAADPEPNTRKLISDLGLPWDDACLEHHKTKSAVLTLSLAQVRQPVYKSSSGGWRRYEEEMQPFIEEWERLKNA